MSLASTVSPRQVLTAFRAIAAVEAVTWAGLLVGMFFKYVVVHNEIGVQIFGPIHGVAFIVYVAVAVLAWYRLGWSTLTAVLGLVASVPPFGTVVFERWASRTGRIDPAGGGGAPQEAALPSARA